MRTARKAPPEHAGGSVPTDGARVVELARSLTDRHRGAAGGRQEEAELARLSRLITAAQLGASLAHELNQPLAAIVSNAQAASRLMERESAPLGEVREALADIAEDARRAGAIIRRLRALINGRGVERQPLDVNQLIRVALTLLRGEACALQVPIDLNLAPRLPAVVGDGVQLEQVLLNLLLNGCDAMREVEPGARRLVVRTAPHDATTVEVAVRDSGVGVAAEDLDHIFRPFFSTKAEGLGLGLAISRSIIEAHGGRLWASRNVERGLTLHFTLPAIPEPSPGRPTTRASS